MKNTNGIALKTVLLVFSLEFLFMGILNYTALPQFLGTLLDSAAIAGAALFVLRYYNRAMSCAQSKFSSFAAQIPDSVIITDPDGKITYVNPAFEKVTGYMLGEAVGETPARLKNGKQAVPFYREMWRTLKSGRPWRGQLKNKKKDGTFYTEDAVIFPIKGENGKPTEFVGIWKDVTDKLLAEEKSREYLQTIEITNAILSLSLENRPLPEILQGALNKILSVKWLSIEPKGAVFLTDERTNSLKMAAQTGLEEFIMKSCAEVPAGRCLCGKALLSGQPIFKPHLDGDHETAYKGIYDHGHYIMPITAGDAVYGVINVYTQAGHARSDSDIRFLTAIAGILAGIIYRKSLNDRLFLLKDLQTKVINTVDTKAALKLLMEDLCGITGWPAGEVWLPDTDKLHLYLASSYCAAGHKIEAFAKLSRDYKFKKGEGLPGRVWESREPAWVPDVSKDAGFQRKDIAVSCGIKANYAAPILVNGEAAVVLNFYTTKVKQEDAEFVDFLAVIAGQIGAAFQKSQLSEQLVQAQKMDTVGKLAGGIAHDFNNILGAISGYADFLLKDLKNMPRQLADVREVKKAVERAAALTKQLLAFSRKKAAVRKVVNLNSAISGLLPMLEKITAENIKLGFFPMEGLSQVKIDLTHLEQVIINLVVNARDAMPEGGTITIRTGETLFADDAVPAGLTAGKYVVFSVSDTGTGMSEETRQRIFEPFFTTKPVGKGTGLGLSIVYGVIKQNKARITVDSILNEGSTFTVYIPVAAESETSSAPEGQGQGVSLNGTETVLIAEDDEAFRMVLSRGLKEHGYGVLEASNADEALSLAKAHSGEIQLLLTDIRMPGKNGVELAEELLRSRPGTGILYMTGYPDTDILDKHHVNEEAQLRKPVEFPLLLAKVREVLDKGRPVKAG